MKRGVGAASRLPKLPRLPWADLVPPEPGPGTAMAQQMAGLQSLVTVMARRELLAQMALALARQVLVQAEKSVARSHGTVVRRQRKVADFRRGGFAGRLDGQVDIQRVRRVLADESRLVTSAALACQQLETQKAEAAEADAELQRRKRLLRILAIRREKYESAMAQVEADTEAAWA